METLKNDVRFGLRSLAKSPVFTAVAALTLALGIGATSSIFSVINAVLLSALPYENPQELVSIGGTLRRDSRIEEGVKISYPDFEDWRDKSDIFEELAAYTSPRSFNLMAEDEPERISAEFASEGYFRLLGQEAVQGRVFTAEEASAGESRRLAIVSYQLWQSHFGLDPALVRKTLSLNDEIYEVIGIMPAGFRGLTDKTQIWLPINLAGDLLGQHYIQSRRARWLFVLGRLRSDTTLDQAQTTMDALTVALEEEHPRSNRGFGVRLVPLAETWFGQLRPAFWTLLGGALFVLLIACANVANFLVVRTMSRRRELSVRVALGAGRGNLVRQLLVESVLLTILGCAAGFLLAHWMTGFLVGVSAVEFKSFVQISLNPFVICSVVGLALLCTLGFGLVPALFTSQINVSDSLKEGTRRAGGSGQRRFQSYLIVLEVALALVLLAGAALMFQAFQRFSATDLGFRSGELLTMSLDLKGERYSTGEAKRQLFDRFLERLGAVEDVDSLVLEGPGMPTSEDWYGAYFTVDGRRDSEEDKPAVLLHHFVSPEYFNTLGIPLLQGRDFTRADDTESEPVVVVSESMARRFWPNIEPIGQRLKWGRRDNQLAWYQVVGVVGDVKHRGLSNEGAGESEIYFSIFQVPPASPPVVNFLVRPVTASTATALITQLREGVRSIVPELTLYDIATMEQRLGRQIAKDRFLVLLLILFASLALVLAVVGIYGLISYSVSQRTTEIGVRMAFGARPRQVAGMVLLQGGRLALLGTALGLTLVFSLNLFLGHVLTDLLHGQSAVRPLNLAGTSLVLFTVALAASYIPALRAARFQPMTILRTE